MSHDQVQRDDVVDRYVRAELGSDERLAFEEHFFECAECFGELLRMEEIITGVRMANDKIYFDGFCRVAGRLYVRLLTSTPRHETSPYDSCLILSSVHSAATQCIVAEDAAPRLNPAS
jgi:hypothetical protein